MADAWALGARISNYEPDYAIVVSTDGVAPDAQRHFNKMTNTPESARYARRGIDTNMVYVEKIEDLASKLTSVVNTARAANGLRVMGFLEQISHRELSLSNWLMSSVVGPNEKLLINH